MKIDKNKLNEGQESLSQFQDSIDLVKKFPVKGGYVKPSEYGWFESIKTQHQAKKL